MRQIYVKHPYAPLCIIFLYHAMLYTLIFGFFRLKAEGDRAKQVPLTRKQKLILYLLVGAMGLLLWFFYP